MGRVAFVRHEVPRRLIARSGLIVSLCTGQVGLRPTPSCTTAAALLSTTGTRSTITILLAVAREVAENNQRLAQGSTAVIALGRCQGLGRAIFGRFWGKAEMIVFSSIGFINVRLC